MKKIDLTFIDRDGNIVASNVFNEKIARILLTKKDIRGNWVYTYDKDDDTLLQEEFELTPQEKQKIEEMRKTENKIKTEPKKEVKKEVKEEVKKPTQSRSRRRKK